MKKRKGLMESGDEKKRRRGEERGGGVDVFKMDKKQESHFLNSFYSLCLWSLFREHDAAKPPLILLSILRGIALLSHITVGCGRV